MRKENMNTVLIEKFKNQTGLNVFAIDETGYYNAPVYAEFLEEEIASRDSRQLSAVPSGIEADDELIKRLNGQPIDTGHDMFVSGWNECYQWVVEIIKQRGIAG